jgi:hypothetical protein
MVETVRISETSVHFNETSVHGAIFQTAVIFKSDLLLNSNLMDKPRHAGKCLHATDPRARNVVHREAKEGTELHRRT